VRSDTAPMTDAADQAATRPEDSRESSWRSWWTHPANIRAVGEEPDYRFTLANERTVLAWIRTSLAMLAGGVAVVQIVPSFGVPGGRHILGVPLIVMSVVVAVSSYRHWADSEKALRLGRPLPQSPLPRLLGLGVAVISLAALVFVLVGTSPHPA
jgi:putative membrane protein